MILRSYIAILLGLSASLSAAESIPLRVLFVGNSYTFHNDLPELFRVIARSGGKWEPEVKAITDGGMRLFEHVERGEVSRALKEGASNHLPWDVVVLQEQSVVTSLDASSNGVDFREKFHRAALQLSTEAHRANPEVLVVLFQTWARHTRLFTSTTDFAANGKDPTEMMGRVHENYAAAAKGINEVLKRQRPVARVCPAGDFWSLVLQTSAAPELHSEDGSHPSPTGSWFTALTLTGTILGKSAIQTATWEAHVPSREVTLLKNVLLNNPNIFHQAAD